MEYLKGSYSMSNIQATFLTPPLVIVIVTGKPTLNSLTKYVSMEYLKGSYSMSNTQATSVTPPGSPNPCDLDLVRISFVFLFFGTAPWFPRDPPPGSPVATTTHQKHSKNTPKTHSNHTKNTPKTY